MNIASYLAAKANGLVEIKQYGPDFMIIRRKFNADTGAETTPEAQAFKRDDLIKQRQAHQDSIVEIDAVLADLDAIAILK